MTKEEEIISGNEAIAYFMEAKAASLPFGDDYLQMDSTTFPNLMYTCKISELEYHSSIDWLRPVMQKICEFGYTVQWTICDNSTCRIWPYLKGVKSCCIITDRPWTAIVQFCEFYKNLTR